MSDPSMGKRRRGDSACRRAAIEVLELRRLLSAGAPETDDHAHYGETDADVAGAEQLQNRDWAEPVFVGPKQWFGEFGITAQAAPGAGTGVTGRQPIGALTGKIVYTVGGHGFTAFSGGWHTQRGENNEMVEDLGNQDQMTAFVDYAWNAGATVVPLRPVGYQPNEYVVDNDDSSVTYTGAWSNSTSTIFYGSAGDVPYRFASISASQTAVAKYAPNITVAGHYPVYAWTRNGSDRVNQLYKVTHAGGTTDVRINHRRVGNGWVYLGTYYFNSGTGGYVEVSNQSSEASGVVIADAIRFGNGMGNIDRGLGNSQQTRSDESSLYWIEAQKGQGVSDSTFRGTIGTDDDDNVGAPPRWAAWMNREQEGAFTDRIFLSFHSNAGGGRGTVGLWNDETLFPGTATPHQLEWASYVGNEVNDDMVAIGTPTLEHAWSDRANPTFARSDFAFGEINDAVIGGEFDATILEVAFHDSATDAELMRDAKVRNWVARAAMQAAVRYFNQYSGTPINFLPEPPTNVRTVVAGNGDVTVSWAAPVVDAIGGQAATGYVVYRSSDGKSFANPTVVSGGGTLSQTFTAAQLGTGVKYFRVVATNAGGDSMMSEVVASRYANSALSPILIVNAFDRVDRNQDVRQTTPLSYDPPFAPGSGSTFDRVRPRFGNSFDYVVQAASAIATHGTIYGFDTAQNEAVGSGAVNLANYKAVIWLAGEEDAANSTFTSAERTAITNFVNAGGKLFASGSDIANELSGNAFLTGTLHAAFSSNDANSYTASGVAGKIFQGLNLTFDNGAQFYDVDAPDVITAASGSDVALNYGSGGAAAVQWTNGTARVVYMGFPFETITTATNRNAVMNAVLTFFGNLNPVPTGSGAIRGRVFRDVNGDGVFNGVDVPYPGWTAFIDNVVVNGLPDPGEQTFSSDDEGSYALTGLTDGTYSVREVLQSNHVRTAPAGGYSVTITGQNEQTGKDFANFPTLFVGTSEPDSYTIVMDPALNGKVQVLESLNGGAVTTYAVTKSLVPALTFSSGGGDDAIVIDYTNGSPMPGSGITVSGGSNDTAAGDQINIIGTSSADTLSAGPSSLTGMGNLPYSGIERITFNGGGGDDILNHNAPGAAMNMNGGAGTNRVNLNSGTMSFASDAGAGGSVMEIVIAGGASASFDGSQHLANLTINNGASATMLAAGAGRYLHAKLLSIAADGVLDMNDNDLIVEYSGGSVFTTVWGWVLDGFSGTVDPSTRGIVSGVSQNSGGSQILALFDNALLGASEWPPGSGNLVPTSAVIGRFTYFGDANIDGQVTGDDYTVIDANLNTIPPTGLGWLSGDANLDGAITGDDYTVIDANLGLGT